MKFYIAARLAKADTVKEIYQHIQDLGHEIAFDWMHTTDIHRPYAENARKVCEFADAEAKGILETDVFIILSDPGGTGMYVELGIAIAKYYFTKGKSPRIYAIGEHQDVTAFHMLSCIRKKDTFEDVLKDLGL